VYGDDPRLQNSKPAPDIFQICAESMAVKPDYCIAFEDSRNGVTSALAADMQVIAIDSPYVEPGDLANATLVIKSYAEAQKLFEKW
jgi:pseudouridine-5'-monophosphatase